MKRREFMNFVGLGMVATSLPVALAACNSSESAAETDATAADPCAADPCAAVEVDSSIRDDGFAALGTVAELDSAGFLASKPNTKRNLLLLGC